jgi:hypothetical protein
MSSLARLAAAAAASFSLFLAACSSAPAAEPLADTSAAAKSAWWKPTGILRWQWVLTGTLDLDSPRSMGTNDTAENGDVPPATDPSVYDVDGILNPASTVSALHAMGDHVVCYIEVGTAGDYYTAAEEGISTTYYAQLQAAGVLGKKLSGYPEYFLDIHSASTVSIIEAMIDDQCAAKGFDAVETDLDETFDGNEGPTGFKITEADEEAFMTLLAKHMHAAGLAWVIKNPDDVGKASYANAMYPLADAVLTEQCNQYDTCKYLAKYEGTKAIFNAEYDKNDGTDPPSTFCPADDAAGISGTQFKVDLRGAWRVPCE